MRQLKNQITKNGFVYKLHKKDVGVYWYKQFTLEGNFISNEVFKEVIAPECTLQNKDGSTRTIEEGIRFPHDNAFSVWAWSTRYEDRAEERFNKIRTEYANNKKNKA